MNSSSYTDDCEDSGDGGDTLYRNIHQHRENDRHLGQRIDRHDGYL